MKKIDLKNADIKKYRPNVMLEIQENSTKLFGYMPEDIFKFMRELGYKEYYIMEDKNIGQKLCPVNNSSENLPDYNFLFIHNSRSEHQVVFARCLADKRNFRQEGAGAAVRAAGHGFIQKCGNY